MKKSKNEREEKESRKMENRRKHEDELVFVSFCIEEYKASQGMSGEEVASLFEKWGLIDYLMEHYVVLHSMGRDQILQDISLFLSERRPRR